MTKEHKGEVFIFLEALSWSFFPVVTILSYAHIHPLVSFAGSLVFSALFFAIILTVRKTWHELKSISTLKDIWWITFFIGIGFYGLYFLALRYTTAGNASVIALVETFFTFLFFNVWKKEYISRQHIIGAILMVLGAIIILSHSIISFHKGDFIMLLATAFPPIGNYFQQKSRKTISPETIMFGRTVMSMPFVAILILLFAKIPNPANLKLSIWFFAINGIVLFGLSKIFWLEAIHRISVTKAASLSSIGPFFTILISWIFLHDKPIIWQFLALVPMILGIYLLTQNKDPIISV